MPQPLQFPVHSSRVLLLRRGPPQHRPSPTLARVVANQHRQQLVTVQSVGLHSPRPAVHFDARRIHHHVVDTLFDKPTVQPEAVAPRLVTAVHIRLRAQPAARLGLGDAFTHSRRVPPPPPCPLRATCSGSALALRRSGPASSSPHLVRGPCTAPASLPYAFLGLLQVHSLQSPSSNRVTQNSRFNSRRPNQEQPS